MISFPVDWIIQTGIVFFNTFTILSYGCTPIYGNVRMRISLDRILLSLLKNYIKIIIVPNSDDRFVCFHLGKRVKEAGVRINNAHQCRVLYFNGKQKVCEIQITDYMLLGKHWLSLRCKKSVGKLVPKFIRPIKELEG